MSDVYIDLNDPTVFQKYCSNVEKMVKHLKTSTKYKKPILNIMEQVLDPIYTKWISRAYSELPNGPYSKYKPSQLRAALSKSKLKSKTINRGISDFIAYFYVKKLSDTPVIEHKNGKKEKLLQPRSYYTMLDSGIEPHSLGKGNMTKKSAFQRITTNTKTSNYHNKGYYLRMIDLYSDRVASAEKRLKKYQKEQAKGNVTTKVRKGRGFVTSKLSTLIQNARDSISRNFEKMTIYQERYRNVDKWSQHGTKNVVRSNSTRYWYGKKFANHGVEYMLKARQEARSNTTKKQLSDRIQQWAYKQIISLQEQ